MKYKTLPISELIDEIAMGPFGSNIKVDCFVEDGIPVLNGSNLEGYTLKEDSFRYVTEEKADSLRKANAYRGDVIITHRGTLGQIVYIPDNSKYKRYVISQSQFRIKCNNNILPEYMVYYFHTRLGQHKLLSNASQVGVPALARPSSTFQKIEIKVPDMNIQKNVVSIIQTIQDKIDINNQINNNLMEQARTLLRIYISNSEDLQFITLGEVAEINKGTYSPKEKWPFINYLDTSSVTDGVVSELQYLDTASDKVPSRARRKLQKNDIVFSIVRPNQRHFAIITKLVSNMLASTGFAVIRSNAAGISNELLYLCLTENMFIEQMQQIAEQSTSTFPSIKPSDLESCKIPSFSSDQSEELNRALASIFSLYSMHQLENNSLSQLRDTLLPKLMSGEIDISDIDL